MMSVSLCVNVSVGPLQAQAGASSGPHGPHQREEETAHRIAENDADAQALNNRAAIDRKPSGESVGSELDTLLAQPSPLDKYR